MIAPPVSNNWLDPVLPAKKAANNLKPYPPSVWLEHRVHEKK